MAEQAPRPVVSTRTRQRRESRGAALVEFVVVLPRFLAIAFGVLTGGAAYNQKLAITNAAREGARYGATLPPSGAWLQSVKSTVIGSASGELDAGKSGRYVCIALFDGTTWTRSVEGSGTPTGSGCWADGRTDSRVQIRVQRTAKFNAYFFQPTVTLAGQAVARYEDFG